MNEPHAPAATAQLPDSALQLTIERAICMVAAEELSEAEWAKELRAAVDPRQTISRFAQLRDDAPRLSIVIALQGLRTTPEAWTCGIEAALDQFPAARSAVLDIVRTAPSGDGPYAWRP